LIGQSHVHSPKAGLWTKEDARTDIDQFAASGK